MDALMSMVAEEGRLLAGGGEDGFTFAELYNSLVFMVVLWLSGKAAGALGMPALVGEMVTGIVLGPNLLAFVPKVGAYKLIGEIGLMLLVVEAGLDVDLEMLRVIGMRGALVAIFGSMVPLAIGYGIGSGIMGLDMKGSFVIGASVAPTSMGIALNVLRSGKLLNTPVGQLVIAAAVLDDIIALVLLSELQALDEPSAWAFAQPVVVAAALLIGFGGFAIMVMPKLMQKVVFRFVPESRHELVTLGLIFGLTLALAPFARFAGSSYLLGCFIAGVCFCTESKVHHVWASQVKRILSWLLRIFFACTIGFEVPVQAFLSVSVVRDGGIIMVAIVGKLLMGFFAKPFTLYNGCVIAFAMSAWGEFAFIVILYAKREGIVSEDVSASVIFAILLSVIISPIFLRKTITYFSKKALDDVEAAVKDTGSKAVGTPPLYYFIQSSSTGGWGQQDRLLRALVDLDLHIIDMRSFHPHNNSLDVQVVYEIYLKDPTMTLPAASYHSPSEEQEEAIQDRLDELQKRVLEALGDKSAMARVGRWFAGLKPEDDYDHKAYKEARKLLAVRGQSLRSIASSHSGGSQHSDDPARDKRQSTKRSSVRLAASAVVPQVPSEEAPVAPAVPARRESADGLQSGAHGGRLQVYATNEPAEGDIERLIAEASEDTEDLYEPPESFTDYTTPEPSNLGRRLSILSRRSSRRRSVRSRGPSTAEELEELDDKDIEAGL